MDKTVNTVGKVIPAKEKFPLLPPLLMQLKAFEDGIPYLTLKT